MILVRALDIGLSDPRPTGRPQVPLIECLFGTNAEIPDGAIVFLANLEWVEAVKAYSHFGLWNLQLQLRVPDLPPGLSNIAAVRDYVVNCVAEFC